MDAVFFVSGDAEALRHSRAARVLVATSRELATLQEAGVQLDALVGSGEDEAEVYRAGRPRSGRRTSRSRPQAGSAAGCSRAAHSGSTPLPGPVVDTYGAGDCFASGLTFALARGDAVEDAVALAARCGAAVMTGRGPYSRPNRAGPTSCPSSCGNPPSGVDMWGRVVLKWGEVVISPSSQQCS